MDNRSGAFYIPKVEDRALRSILSRSRTRAQSERGTRPTGKGDKATMAERRDDVDKALGWLKKEMAAMRQDDQHLMRQLVSINRSIDRLKQKQIKDEWVCFSDSAEESDGDADPSSPSLRPRVSSWGPTGRPVSEFTPAVSPLVKPKARRNRSAPADAAWSVRSPESGKRLAPPAHLCDSIRAAETCIIEEEEDDDDDDGGVGRRRETWSLGRNVGKQAYSAINESQ